MGDCKIPFNLQSRATEYQHFEEKLQRFEEDFTVSCKKYESLM
jgi:hypothetical protein